MSVVVGQGSLITTSTDGTYFRDVPADLLSERLGEAIAGLVVREESTFHVMTVRPSENIAALLDIQPPSIVVDPDLPPLGPGTYPFTFALQAEFGPRTQKRSRRCCPCGRCGRGRSMKRCGPRKRCCTHASSGGGGIDRRVPVTIEGTLDFLVDGGLIGQRVIRVTALVPPPT